MLIITCLVAGYSSFIPYVFAGYIFGYSIGLGGTANAYVAEFVPPIGVGFVVFIQGLSTIGIVKIAPIMFDA